VPFPPRKAAPSEYAPKIFYKEALLPIHESRIRAAIRNAYAMALANADQENVSVPKIRIGAIPDRGYHDVA
jgi:hypothetical protein